MITNVFLDTEFTNLSNPGSLVSIGLVNESGTCSFYSELTDTYSRENCSEFVKNNVLPLLDSKPLACPVHHNHINAKMTLNQTRQYLQQWIECQINPIQIWSDAPHYDWPYLKEIFSRELPSAILTNPKSAFADDASLSELFEDKVTQAYALNRLIRHHALDDARAVRLGWLAIKALISSSNRFNSFVPYFNNLN